MTIQWYPGHMHKASKEMVEVLPSVDIIIELLDARIPYSSENPKIAAIRGDKPCIKLLNKSDLADPVICQQWQAALEQQAGVKTLLINNSQQDRANRIIELCKKLAPQREASVKDITAMVLGIPNVGKSTLINTLAGRAVAKTGNEPAITKGQQRINLRNGIVLLDTPGILWPKFDNQNSGYRLAITGAIKDTAISHEDIAFFAAEYLLKTYPERLQERYQLLQIPSSEVELMELIGAQRGCLRSGGHVDFEKVSTILLNELRSGQLGPICLETPAMVEYEKLVVAKEQAEAAKQKEEKAALRKKRRKKKH
jgi:ribosome biogenesis GTPase A